MIIAGLTGGIATGKSTVAAFLKQAGAVLIDADKIAHDVVRRGLPAWNRIVERFGDGILVESGEIDRAKLGSIIFNDPASRDGLNRIVHPFVRLEIDRRMKDVQSRTPGAVVIQDIPLLFESGMDGLVPTIIVVYVPESLQRARLIARNHLSAKEAMARIRSQMSIEEKRRRADILIDNSGTREQTHARSIAVYEILKNTLPPL